MIKVKDLIKQLKRFPEDSYAYAYEGELAAVVIVSSMDTSVNQELGYIGCSERSHEEKNTVKHKKPIEIG